MDILVQQENLDLVVIQVHQDYLVILDSQVRADSLVIQQIVDSQVRADSLVTHLHQALVDIVGLKAQVALVATQDHKAQVDSLDILLLLDLVVTVE